MQKKLEFVYHGALIFLCATLAWSVWSSAAQEARPSAAVLTNVSATAPGAAADGAASKMVRKKQMETPKWVENLAANFPFLKWTWWGNELWKYTFSLLYIFLAFYVSKVLDYLTRVWLKKWAEKTETKFDDLLLGLLHGPVKVVSFVIFLRIGLDVFDWPEIVDNVLSKAFTIVVAVSLTYMVLKFIDLLLGYWKQRVTAKDDEAFNHQLLPIVRKSLKVFVIVVAVLTTLGHMGVNVTAAIASLSIGGLAVGLAAQDTLANLFGAVAVFVDKPFKIGDRIQIDTIDGSVESIGLRSTRIRNLDGYLVTIPNKTMGNATIINIAARPNIKTVMNIGITYDTPVEKVKLALKLIEDVFRSHPKTADLVMSFNKFENSSLNILVVHWWNGTDMKACLAGLQEMNLSLKERFDNEQINFAFPTQTLYLKQDSEWRVRSESALPSTT
jgi:MscS family membrane protein